MSRLSDATAIPVNGSLVVKDSKLSQILAIKLAPSGGSAIPILAGPAVRFEDVLDFLGDIFITTQFTKSNRPICTNVSLRDLMILSTDYKGMALGNSEAGGDNFGFNIPLIQSNGQIDSDYQITIVNRSTIAFECEIFGNSLTAGNAFIEYSTNTLDNSLNVDIVPNFQKVLISNNFSELQMVMGGLMQKLQEEDARIYTNLLDEVIMGFTLDGEPSEPMLTLFPSKTGDLILYNDESTKISQCRLFRLNNAAPAVNYTTARLIKY